MAAYRADALHGHWVHSHEEDREHEMVFRPADHTFPPSRGRTSLELCPDGTYTESSPGPVDRPEESNGQWSLDGDQLVLEAENDRPGHAWAIAAAEKDRLTLRKEGQP